MWLVWGLCDAGHAIQLSPWVQGVIWGVCDVSSCQISSHVSRAEHAQPELRESCISWTLYRSPVRDLGVSQPSKYCLTHPSVWSSITRKPYCCILDLTEGISDIAWTFSANCDLRNSRVLLQSSTARRQRKQTERKKGCVTHNTSCLCCGHGLHPINHSWEGCGLCALALQRAS